MKILLTGAGGFIGQHLNQSLSLFYDVVSLRRSDLDLTNKTAVDLFFKDKYFDLILHVASDGIKNNNENSSTILKNNLCMFFNIMSNRDKFTKLINFTSGADLDRTTDINQHSNLYTSFPLDEYGMSKNIISRICLAEENCYTFRIFNTFGVGELDTRMIYNNIKNYINHQDICIHKNKYMDFFYIDDLIILCHYYINQKTLPKSIDCCYHLKHTLHDIGQMINHLDSHKVNIKCQHQDMDVSYIGNGVILNNLSLPLYGIQQGLKEMYNFLKQKTH